MSEGDHDESIGGQPGCLQAVPSRTRRTLLSKRVGRAPLSRRVSLICSLSPSFLALLSRPAFPPHTIPLSQSQAVSITVNQQHAAPQYKHDRCVHSLTHKRNIAVPIAAFRRMVRQSILQQCCLHSSHRWDILSLPVDHSSLVCSGILDTASNSRR